MGSFITDNQSASSTMSDECTKADPTNVVLSDFYDDMPDLIGPTDPDSSVTSDDTYWGGEISVKNQGKQVQAVNVRGGRRRKKKSKPKTDMPPKDEKGLSEKWRIVI